MAESTNSTMPGIAVIGMSGRFPNSPDVDAFWRNLRSGAECIEHFTVAELQQAGIQDDLLRNPAYVRAKGFMRDADRFDAARFGMTGREAAQTDPQHRVFLECCLDALADAGCDPKHAGASTGVFAGCGANLHSVPSPAQRATPGSPSADLRHLLASDRDFLATRVSYKLDLRGPSLTIQTACSTSLVAVCLACQNLLTYQCDLALAGGVSIGLPLRSGYLFEPEMIFSPDGHCRPFDAAAQGTVPGDGVGVVVLKRLDEALRDGDHVLATIRGFGLNNDGAAKIGFTAPSQDGQAAVIAQALAVAGFSAQSVGYVEAHGTGTLLGDPIEVAALTMAFLDGGAHRGSCSLGSVKSNIGHLNAAAGIAGLIKVVQMLRHGELPPTLHYQRANPQIDFPSTPFVVNTALRPWVAAQTRRAGVSAFGIGGTNSHVLLEEAPQQRSTRPCAPQKPRRVERGPYTPLDSAETHQVSTRDPASWFYRPHWLPTPWPATRANPPGEYLLFVDGDELAAAVMAKLHPAHTSVIRPGGHFSRDSDGSYTIRLAEYADYSSLITDLSARRKLPDYVLHLWAATEVGHSGEAALEGSLLSVIRLIKALGCTPGSHTMRILTVTCGGQPCVEAPVTRPEHAAALSLARVLPEEYPNLRCAVVDIAETERAEPELLAQHLLSELIELDVTAPQSAVTYRSMQRYVQGFEPVRVAPAVESCCRTRGTYLITGGLGGIGLTLAGYLARTYQARLILIGRSGLPPRSEWEALLGAAGPKSEANGQAALIRGLLALEAHGAEVMVLAADVTDEGELRHALGQARARFGAISGVIHAAGITTGGMVQFQPEAALLSTLAPKLRGTLLLAELLRDEPLDFFVMCSSLTALAGGAGQAGYCAANCFLDAFAYKLRQRGVSAVSINWDGWQSVGAAAKEARNRHRLEPPDYLRPEDGIEVFVRAIHTGWPQVIVSKRELSGRLAARLREITEAPVRKDISAASRVELGQQTMDEVVSSIWQAALGVKRIDVHDNFFALGGDSLLAIEIVAAIRRQLGFDLPAQSLMEAPTLAELLMRIRLLAGIRVPPALPQTLVRLRAGSGEGPPLILIHPVGGQVYFYQELTSALDDGQAVIGIQARSPFVETVTPIGELAASYLRDLRAVQSGGTYLLGGSSFGGIVAYEMGRQLIASGEQVGLVAMIDAPGPGFLPQTLCGDAEILGYLLCRGLPSPSDRARLSQLSEDALIQHFLQQSARRPGPIHAESVSEVARLLQLWRSNYQALLDYKPQPWPLGAKSRIIFFTPTEDDRVNAMQAERAWLPLIPRGMEVYSVSGSHITMNYSPNVGRIAAVLQTAIARVLADSPWRKTQ